MESRRERPLAPLPKAPERGQTIPLFAGVKARILIMIAGAFLVAMVVVGGITWSSLNQMATGMLKRQFSAQLDVIVEQVGKKNADLELTGLADDFRGGYRRACFPISVPSI